MKPSSLCVLSLLFTAACGSAGGDFVGTYNVNGTTTMTAGGETATAPITDPLTIAEGTDSDIVITWGRCFYKADVQDNSAIIRAGTTCSQSAAVDGQTVNTSITINTGTVTLTGAVATLNFTGPVSIVFEGQTHPGTFTSTATLTRVTK